MPDLTDAERDRFEYHPPKDRATAEDHAQARGEVIDCAESLMALVPSGRCRSVVLTKLEEALMWANKGIATEQPS